MAELIGPTISPQEMRRDYIVPIYVMWTSDVPDELAQLALQGVSDVIRASGQDRQIVSFGSRSFGEGEFSSADWYVKEALRRYPVPKQAGYGPQVVTSGLGALFTEEPWQEDTPHWEVMVINQDLTAISEDDYLNFVFGATSKFFPYTIQSITRIAESVNNPTLRNQMVRRTIRHEVGHMFGLPSRDFSVEENLGLHCTNVCTMRQGLSIPEWSRLTREEESKGILFCNDCLNDLERIKLRLKPLPTI